MIVTIMQPAYLPWLGYFHRILLSDLFVVLDHVPIDKSSRTNFASRNKIRTKDGWTWLTVPVRTAGRHDERQLNRLEIANESNWAQKHWRGLSAAYAKAPYWAQHQPFFEALYGQKWERLCDLAVETTKYLQTAFGIGTPMRFSSTMELTGHKDDLILEICRRVGATTYISGPLGRDYLRLTMFEQAGTKVAFHDYRHPTYVQAHPGFEPFMSAVDLLINHGPAGLDVLSHDQGGLSV
jgi:hypothetical protein